MLRVMAILALALGTAVSAAGADGAVEAVIDAEMPASSVPGLSYAVVTDGEITSAGARGLSEAGTDREATQDTPFAAGSITKSVAALAGPALRFSSLGGPTQVAGPELGVAAIQRWPAAIQQPSLFDAPRRKPPVTATPSVTTVRNRPLPTPRQGRRL
jgi:hypothetical protein